MDDHKYLNPNIFVHFTLVLSCHKMELLRISIDLGFYHYFVAKKRLRPGSFDKLVIFYT